MLLLSKEIINTNTHTHTLKTMHRNFLLNLYSNIHFKVVKRKKKANFK